MTNQDRTAFTVDPWDPGYGLAYSEDLDGGAMEASTAGLDIDLEVPAAQWHPIDPDPAVHPPDTMLFLDGVRRIDARVWVHGGAPQPNPGIAASLAVGLVRCDSEARVVDVVVERGLFTAAPNATDIVTRCASYPVRLAAGPAFEQLSLGLQRQLAGAEVQLALAFRAQHPAEDDLLVVDGPLRDRTHVERAVGYIKTHHAAYLRDNQAAVVAALAPGQRTPAFTIGTSWERNSWYLRLPGRGGAPWSGIVRVECAVHLPRPKVVQLADLTASLLPLFASTPQKDPRAPQNLIPIGGLERELRHRLGDQQVLYRALRSAAES